jgi:hypothetical protein
MNENSYLGKLFESIIVFLILLVMIQTFFEEYAVFTDYPVRIRKYALIAGFCFDLIFSIEFLVRLFISAKRGGAAAYMGREGGFIDLFASLPLVLFHSGPLIWITFFSGQAGILAMLGGLSFLKIVKVLRIVRTLRFIRTLKIFGKIKTKHIMTPKYVSRVVSLSITIIVLSLIGFTFVNRGTVVQSKSRVAEKLIHNYVMSSTEHNFKDILNGVDSVLFIEKENETVYSTLTRLSFQDNYFNDDYYRTRIQGYDVYFSNKDMKKTNAFINLLAYSMIIGIIIIISTIFRRFFNKHISGVLGVMLKGYKTTEYLTPVRINGKRRDFETYQLADQYNRKWLPVKRKILEIKQRNL